jgi:hypothetical protein
MRSYTFFRVNGDVKTSRITFLGGDQASAARPSHITSIKMKRTAWRKLVV